MGVGLPDRHSSGVTPQCDPRYRPHGGAGPFHLYGGHVKGLCVPIRPSRGVMQSRCPVLDEILIKGDPGPRAAPAGCDKHGEAMTRGLQGPPVCRGLLCS